jgi:hypothetical protein
MKIESVTDIIATYLKEAEEEIKTGKRAPDKDFDLEVVEPLTKAFESIRRWGT